MNRGQPALSAYSSNFKEEMNKGPEQDDGKALSSERSDTALGFVDASDKMSDPSRSGRSLNNLSVFAGGGFLNLDVSGQMFRIPLKICTLYPATRLGRLASHFETPETAVSEGLASFYDEKANSFYVFRSMTAFQSILTFCQTGKMHKPCGFCDTGFYDELEFWGFSFANKCSGCVTSGRRPSEITLSQSVGSLSLSEADGEGVSDNYRISKNIVHAADSKGFDIFKKYSPRTAISKLREVTWNLVENPGSSHVAMIFCILSMVFILGTVVVSTLESLPHFQEPFICTVTDNETNITVTIEDAKQCGGSKPVIGLVIADVVCIAWFSMEYLLRLWSAPNRCQYVKHPLSIIDLVAILPFYFEIIFTMKSPFDRTAKASHGLVQSAQSGRVLRVFRVLRSLRMLKFARYSSDIRLLALALKRSISELLMIMVYVIFATYFYSTLLYQVDADSEGSVYKTIPAAAWWTMATAFTYSDAPPKTIAGKLIASTGFVAGVLLLAFPITVLVDKFSKIYHEKSQKKQIRTPRKMSRQVKMRNALSTAAGIEQRIYS